MELEKHVYMENAVDKAGSPGKFQKQFYILSSTDKHGHIYVVLIN